MNIFIHDIIQLTITKERKVQIIEPGGGKHILISGDINSILVAKNQTNGAYSIVEGKIYPQHSHSLYIIWMLCREKVMACSSFFY